MPTPDGQGLRTADPASWAQYAPGIAEIAAGKIVCVFALEAPFTAAPAFNDPIILINSNRVGHLPGDFSLRLDPADGKMWFVQEVSGPEITVTLKTTKGNWDAGWYKATITWGPGGRQIKVTWDGGQDTVGDGFQGGCFSSAATITTIGYRDAGAPRQGIVFERITVTSDRHGGAQPLLVAHGRSD